MMKRILILSILLAILLISFISCGSDEQQPDNQVVNIYKAAAEDFISAQDYESAINTLEEGITATNSQVLQDMLNQIKSDQASKAETLNDTESETDTDTFEVSAFQTTEASFNNEYISKFVGVYSNNASWHFGGTIIEISIDNSKLCIKYFLYQASPYSRVAEVGASIDIDSIKSNTVEFEFTDSWNNSGTMLLEFQENETNLMINCETKNLVYENLAVWGVCEESVLLSFDENAFSRMDYSMDEYYEWEALGYPDYDPLTDEYINIETTDQANNYFFYNAIPSYTENTVTVIPKNLYWDNGKLVALCYVVNGYSYSVTNISVDSLSFQNDNVTIASGNFGVLNGLTLKPYYYSEWTFTFSPDAVENAFADLNTTIYVSSSVSKQAYTLQ